MAAGDHSEISARFVKELREERQETKTSLVVKLFATIATWRWIMLKTTSRGYEKRKWSDDDKERTWKLFLREGTRHSRHAMTLPYIINRCEEEGISYQLFASPDEGYFIKPWDKSEREIEGRDELRP